MNLGFVILYMGDMAKAKAFYTEILGMTVVEEISGPNFITLRPTSGSLVGLQDKMASLFPPGLEASSGSVELSFEVDDVDATWKLWKEKGVEIVSDPRDLPFWTLFPGERSGRSLSFRVPLCLASVIS